MSSRSTALSCTTQNRIRGNRIGSETSIVTDSDLCGVTTLRHSAAVMVQFGGTMLQGMLQSWHDCRAMDEVSTLQSLLRTLQYTGVNLSLVGL